MLGAEPVLAPTFLTPLGEDRFFDLDGGLSRAVVRARGPVVQAGLPMLTEPVDPTVGALTRDALGFRGVRDGPPLLTDALDEELAAAHGQTGITVGHEDLRTVGDLDITHRTRRSSLRQRPGRCVTNVLAEYT